MKNDVADTEMHNLRHIDPQTGRLSNVVVQPVKKTADSKAYRFLFLSRYDRWHEDIVAKIQIQTPDGRMFCERDYHQRDHRFAEPVARVLAGTQAIMRTCGAQNLDRLMFGKEAFTRIKELPIRQLREIGWTFDQLPEPGIEFDREDVARKARLAGLLIDGANIVRNGHLGANGVRALKALLDKLDNECTWWHLYFDNSIRWWFHATQNAEGLSLLNWLYSERRRSVTTARKGRSADEMMLRWAYKQGRHIISRDGFQDDPAYTWLQESAKAHYPRLHKYYTHDGVIEIPNLGIEVPFNKVA